MVRPAGSIANVGVHGSSVQLDLQDLWITNIDILDGSGEHRHPRHAAEDGRLSATRPGRFISHRFKLEEIMDAYDVFANAAQTKALKVVLTA